MLAGIIMAFWTQASFACTPISIGWSGDSAHSVVLIDEPGRYCLQETLNVILPDMNGITIVADDVVLDLGGAALLGPKTGTGIGVHILGSNAVVIGGNISGFWYGAWAVSPGAYLSRIDASGNIAGGVRVDGAGAVVEHTRVSRLIAPRKAIDVARPFGVSVSGANCHVRYNMITDTFAPQSNAAGVGLAVSGEGCLVYENMARFSTLAPANSAVFLAGEHKPASVHENIGF